MALILVFIVFTRWLICIGYVAFPERPLLLTLILANPIDTWPGEKGRQDAVPPGDRDMAATPPSNTAGDHGGPAHGDAGNKRFKKPHHRHAHPQGLTDDYELSFQPTEPSRYATLLAISHLLMSPRVCLNSFRTPMMKSISWAFQSWLRTPTVCNRKPWSWSPSRSFNSCLNSPIRFVYEISKGLYELGRLVR